MHINTLTQQDTLCRHTGMTYHGGVCDTNMYPSRLGIYSSLPLLEPTGTQRVLSHVYERWIFSVVLWHTSHLSNARLPRNMQVPYSREESVSHATLRWSLRCCLISLIYEHHKQVTGPGFTRRDFQLYLLYFKQLSSGTLWSLLKSYDLLT